MLLNKCYMMIYHIDTSLVWTLYPTSTVSLMPCKVNKILNIFSIFRQKSTSSIHLIFIDIHLTINIKTINNKKIFSDIHLNQISIRILDQIPTQILDQILIRIWTQIILYKTACIKEHRLNSNTENLLPPI